MGSIVMIVTFLDGELEVSDTTLMAIPYFTGMLEVNPGTKKTHLDFTKKDFVRVLASFTGDLHSYLNLPESKKVDNGFIIERSSILKTKAKLWKRKLSNISTEGKIIVKLYSKKGNYCVNVFVEYDDDNDDTSSSSGDSEFNKVVFIYEGYEMETINFNKYIRINNNSTKIAIDGFVYWIKEL